MKEETIETEGRRRRQTLGRLVSFEVFLPVLFGECLSSCHSPSVFCLSPGASQGLPLNCLFLIPGVSTSFVLGVAPWGMFRVVDTWFYAADDLWVIGAPVVLLHRSSPSGCI